MDTEIIPAEQFDYTGLDPETRIVVKQRTSEIRTIAHRAATDVVEIGQKLIEVKEKLGHGKFGDWLQAEFAWEERTALRFMQVAERFQNRHIVGFAPTALYMLSAPSVPEEARTEAIQRAEAGERITVKAAQTIIADQFATLEQLVGPVRAEIRRLAHGEIPAQKGLLTQINRAQPAGNELLVKIKDQLELAQPARLSDIRTVCQEYLMELLAAEQRPAAQVVYTGVRDTGVRDTATERHGETATERHGDTASSAITVEPTGPGIRTQAEVDLAAAKLRWQVRGYLGLADGQADREKLERAKRLTHSILDLEGFAAARGRNFEWEALVGAVGILGSQDKEALRRAVELEREDVLNRLAALPEPEPLPAPDPADELVDLAAVVLRWLDEKVEENAIPQGVEESRFVLRGIITGRNNGFALAWRELKQQGRWPAGTQDGAKLDAVKAALGQLGGEAPQPAPVERVYVRPGVVPTVGQTMNEIDRLNKKLRELVDLNAKQAERIHGQVVAIDKALGYLKSLAIREEEAIDEDLIETIAALETAR